MKTIREYPKYKDSEGSILVVALIMLVLLSIIGFAVTTTSRIEVQVASNEYVAKQNLYAAEGAAMECVQEIKNGDSRMKFMSNDTPFWMVNNDTGQNNSAPAQPVTPYDPVNDPLFPPELMSVNNWGNNLLARQSPFVNNTRALAFFMGLAPGASKDMTKPQVVEYRVFGRSNLYAGTRNDGWSIVEVGYRRAF